MEEKDDRKKSDKGSNSRLDRLVSTVKDALKRKTPPEKAPDKAVEVAPAKVKDTHQSLGNADIDRLREKCNNTPLFPKLSDHQLKIFYAAGACNVDTAYEGVMEYFTQKKESRYMFENRDPFSPDILRSWDVLKVSFLPNLTPAGNRILLCGLWDHDPLNMDVLACIRMFLMAVDVGLFLEKVYPGYVLLLDTDGLSIRHFPWGSLTDYRKFMKFLQLFFHSGDEFEIFHQMVPPECLPTELGGLIPSVRPIQDELRKKVELTIVALSQELDAVLT